MQEHLTLFLIKEESKWSDEDVDSQAGKREENLLKNIFKEDLMDIVICVHVFEEFSLEENKERIGSYRSF